jgi:hypothetical protein
VYTVSGSLNYTPFEGDGYEGIKFTGGDGTVIFAEPLTVRLLVVAGGGGGSNALGTNVDQPGGGGAGGLVYQDAYALSAASSYAVNVGTGGAIAGKGNDSWFGVTGEPASYGYDEGTKDLKAEGGGRGADGYVTSGAAGGTGGSGGGGAAGNGQAYTNGGAAVNGASAAGPYYGNAGGAGSANGGGGGGGAGGAGLNSPGTPGGAGGAGKSYDIDGAEYVYATGGRGGHYSGTEAALTDDHYGNGGNANQGDDAKGRPGVVVLRWAK